MTWGDVVVTFGPNQRYKEVDGIIFDRTERRLVTVETTGSSLTMKQASENRQRVDRLGLRRYKVGERFLFTLQTLFPRTEHILWKEQGLNALDFYGIPCLATPSGLAYIQDQKICGATDYDVLRELNATVTCDSDGALRYTFPDIFQRYTRDELPTVKQFMVLVCIT